MNLDRGSPSVLSDIGKTFYKLVAAGVAVATLCQPLLNRQMEHWLGSMDEPVSVSERFEDFRRYTAEFENHSEDRTIEDFTIRVDLAGVAGDVAVLEHNRLIERLESPDGRPVASKAITLNPGQQIRCEIDARDHREFTAPPRVEAYAKNIRVGTPAESGERGLRARARARHARDTVWSISLIAAGLFCVASLAIVIWLDRALRRAEVELEDERRLRLALAGARPPGEI